ncbi:hypothetical protein BKA64DRAFT_668267 [Cadophora sp. MPI-SDFR-AT-0126]|nr:hypothetical protein BKA64DRAFT_668267 [Leotiomycetes sp. MPI-SDFR-AT-0126]
MILQHNIINPMIPLTLPALNLPLPRTPLLQPSIKRKPRRIPPLHLLLTDSMTSQPCFALSLLPFLSFSLLAPAFVAESSALFALEACALLVCVGAIVAGAAAAHGYFWSSGLDLREGVVCDIADGSAM